MAHGTKSNVTEIATGVGSQPPLIYRQIARVMADMEAIGKARRNQQQGFQYRGIDDIYNQLHSVLARHEVFSVPTVIQSTRSERTSKAGGILFHVELQIRYDFYAADGSSFSAVVVGEGMDSGDKASNKAMAVAHKYAFTQILTIPTEDDKDPDAHSHEVVKPKKAKAEEAPLPFELGKETVVPSGHFRGMRLGEKSRHEWHMYAKEVAEKLKSPNFPADAREDAENLVEMLMAYVDSIPTPPSA